MSSKLLSFELNILRGECEIPYTVRRFPNYICTGGDRQDFAQLHRPRCFFPPQEKAESLVSSSLSFSGAPPGTRHGWVT